jgi:hypothetical protein
MEVTPTSLDNFRRTYYWGRFEDFARHKVATALSKEQVPAYLYPNELSRAEQLIVNKHRDKT